MYYYGQFYISRVLVSLFLTVIFGIKLSAEHVVLCCCSPYFDFHNFRTTLLRTSKPKPVAES